MLRENTLLPASCHGSPGRDAPSSCMHAKGPPHLCGSAACGHVLSLLWLSGSERKRWAGIPERFQRPCRGCSGLASTAALMLPADRCRALAGSRIDQAGEANMAKCDGAGRHACMMTQGASCLRCWYSWWLSCVHMHHAAVVQSCSQLG